MRDVLKLMRVHHYIKNLLVFVALACSGKLFDGGRLLDCALGFAAFCLLSSAVYIVNDIRDREKDRLHPTKRERPVASGRVSVPRAWMMAGAALLGALVCNLLAFRPVATVLLAMYLLLNLGYSFGLKDVPIADIAILVSGFLLRMLYGASVAGIRVSNWLYLTVLSMAAYFALGKRRNELMRTQTAGETRRVLAHYTQGFLDKNMYMFLGIANVFYALWSMDENTVRSYGHEHMIFTVPIVMLITMRYSMVVESDSDGDPVEVLLHDRPLLILCAAYLAAMFVMLYL